MRGRHRIWIVGLLAAACGGAAVGVHASSAAPTRASVSASTLDKTFSCRVRKQRFINVATAVTLPPINNQPQPGGLFLTTAQKTRKVNNATVTLTQVSLQAAKNSLRIDTSSCSHVKQQIPLKPKGLQGPTTVTPTLFGRDTEQCGTAGRVLVRLRVTSTNHTPTHALLAIRNDNAKKQPIAFYNWTSHKVNLYVGNTCKAG
jgi:hypothetical protein